MRAISGREMDTAGDRAHLSEADPREHFEPERELVPLHSELTGPDRNGRVKARGTSEILTVQQAVVQEDELVQIQAFRVRLGE